MKKKRQRECARNKRRSVPAKRKRRSVETPRRPRRLPKLQLPQPLINIITINQLLTRFPPTVMLVLLLINIDLNKPQIMKLIKILKLKR